MPAGKLTREFLKSGCKVYTRNRLVVNTSLAAVAAFFAMNQYSYHHISYPQKMPELPHISVQHLDELGNPLWGVPEAGKQVGMIGRIPDVSDVDYDESEISKEQIEHLIHELRSAPSASEAALDVDPGEDVSSAGFDFMDLQGVQSQSIMAQYASLGGGVMIGEVNREDFSIPAYKIDKEIHDAIELASASTGVSKGVLYAFASKESNFRKTAQASSSSARGIFQHTDGTWRNLLKKVGMKFGYLDEASQIGGKGIETYFKTNKAAEEILALRDVPRHSAIMGAALLIDNINIVEKSLDRKLKLEEYYVTHLMGAPASIKFLRAKDADPNIRVNQISGMSKAIKANKTIFMQSGRYRTVSEVMGWVDEAMTKRMSYFTLKYEGPDSRHYQEAVDFAKKMKLLERHEGKRAVAQNEKSSDSLTNIYAEAVQEEDRRPTFR